MREIKLRDGEVGLFFRRCMRLCSISKMSTVWCDNINLEIKRGVYVIDEQLNMFLDCSLAHYMFGSMDGCDNFVCVTDQDGEMWRYKMNAVDMDLFVKIVESYHMDRSVFSGVRVEEVIEFVEDYLNGDDDSD